MRPLTFALTLAVLTTATLSVTPPSFAAPPGGSKPRPSGGGSAPQRALPHHLSASEYLPTSALRPGMKGYGLTIFQGTKIERFDVTILGVLKKVNSGRDLIFVRLGGPNMKRYTDVIAGMSGSPVYVNGRIVGAVAYGAQFTREPLGYLTPIEDMLDAWDPHLPQSAEESLPDLPGRPPAPPGGVKAADSRLPHPLRPLMTPVSLSGMPRARFAQWAAALEPLGLRVKMSPVGAASAATTGAGLQGSALAPGGAVAMSLATGDIDVSGIGTLTYRRDKRIVAFGHPFMGIGPINAPMYTARIHDVQPSFAESEKIGSAVSLVGAFTQDRPFSIGGTIGATPKMVPITVRVDDKAFRRQRTFQAKLVRHPMLTPVLAPLAAGSAIAEMHGQPGDAMATVKLTVEADEVGTVTRTNRFFDPATIDMPATSELSQLMRTLATNPFYPVGVRRITMDVTIEPGRRTAQVERIFLKQTQFEPGDTVQVGVVLKPYKAERFVRNVSLRIPPGTPNGTLLLMVQGGGGMAGGVTIGPGGTLVLSGGANPNAASVRQIVRDFAERERNDQIVARVMLASAAVSVRGEKLSGLPPHLDAVMRAGRSSGLRLEREEVKSTVDTQYVLSGLQYLPIRVSKKGVPQRGSGGTLVAPTTLPGSNPTIPAAAPGTPGAPLGIDPDDEEMIRAGLAGLLPESLRSVVLPAPPVGEEEKEEEEPAGEASRSAEADDKPAAGDAAATAPEAKSVVRAPGLFRQASAAEFRAGTLEGLTLTSEGEMRLAPRLAKVAESDDPYFWAIVPDGAGGVFVGSGDSGRVYRVGADGKRTVFAETGEFEVHALARAADGSLYAGTSPNGRVVRISSDGKVTPLLDTPERYVLALATGKDDTLYIGTGGSRARVYAVKPGAAPIKVTPAPVYASSEGSVTALATGPDGTIYAGTAPGGLVVRVAGPAMGAAAASKPDILFDAAEASVSGLAVAPDGSVCAATFGSPSGALYRITPDGSATRSLLAEKPTASVTYYGMATGPDGTVYTSSGSTVIAVGPDQTVRSFEAPSDIQILALARDERGRLWAATGNVGGVYALGGASEKATKDGGKGVFTSSVLDARANAVWGTLRFSAALPEGSRVAVRTRSGSVAEPDATWSDWSPAITTPTGAKVSSPPGRYLQYRVTFTSGVGGAEAGSPALRTVEAFYRTPNQSPTVAITAPRGGEVWRGTKTLRWTGTDPDRDALTYEVQISADGGRTWKPVESAKLKPAAAAADSAKKAPAPGSPEAERAENEKKMIQSLEAELAKHPEMSAEMKARILADAPASIRAALEGQIGPLSAVSNNGTRETSLALDTAQYPDGVYRVRVVASDRPANADDPKTGEKLSAEFRIVNKPPTLTLGQGGPTSATDRSVRVEGTALHALVAIRAVQWRVNGGDWMAASAADGLFDSGSEAFRVTTAALPAGTHKLEIQAIDEAGGSTTETVTVTVK